MLNGKTAIVTGGLGDLGKAMARHLAQNGAHVVIWDIVPQADAAEAVSAVQEQNPQVEYAEVDVRDRAAVDQAIVRLPQLDIVCSNAGIVDAQPFLELSGENWQNHLDINLTGCFNVCQAAARRMVAEGNQGRIIMTSSWVAEIPWPEISAYTVSKAGVNMLVKQMARELAPHGILVNAVAPGIVNAGLARTATARGAAIRRARRQSYPARRTGQPGRDRGRRCLPGQSANRIYDRQHPDARWGLFAFPIRYLGWRVRAGHASQYALNRLE